MKVSRRSLLAAGAAGGALNAIPFSAWIEKTVGAAGPVTRPNAYSAAGQEMLKVYGKAVKTMMDTPEGKPVSWVFQWYTHWVKGPSTLTPKAQEIQRIYGSTQSDDRALAEAMWDTCQSHGGVDDQDDMFLPWHRMYVVYLEQIVRATTGMNDFALPYWNYSNAAESAIPAEFRKNGDPLLGSLYRQQRNPGVNDGKAIGTPEQLSATPSLSKTQFESSSDVNGFSDELNGGLHGAVHVLVGNTQNMGRVPWAAGDPIFWMHHCNIDRLWASWNKAGRKNPDTDAWLDKTFVFAGPDGKKVVAKVRDFLETERQGYVYDAYEPVPAAQGAPTGPALLAAARPSALTAGKVTLGAGKTQVALTRETGTTALHTTPLAAVATQRPVLLVFAGMETQEQPGVLYDVYLNLPDGATPSTSAPQYAGSINFFNATQTHEAGAHGNTQTVNLPVSAALRQTGGAGDAPTVTLVPNGTPESGAAPIIGQVKLVTA